jgi:fructan beta-fructosidase
MSPPDFRPRLHFSPERHWLNDPNGLVWFEGEYHLFYQCNPFANGWGRCSWGHAVSRDLLHWEPLPVAIAEAGGEMVFSGSGVVDAHNSSGFHPNGGPVLVAIYTGHHRERDRRENQNLAYSLDRGRTWIRYAENPVLDLGRSDFRDPKVFWHPPSARWVMVVTFSNEAAVGFFASPDLKQWTALSRFTSPTDEPLVWECADCLPLPLEHQTGATRWTLVVSRRGAKDGRITRVDYWTGTFDGATFTPDDAAPTRLDGGPDFFATATWSNLPSRDGRQLALAWLANFSYVFQPATALWSGVLSVPREWTLRRRGAVLRLRQRPWLEYEQLRQRLPLRWSAGCLAALEGAPRVVRHEPCELEFEFVPGPGRGALELLVGASGAAALIFGYDASRQELYLERPLPTTVAVPVVFAGRWAMTYQLQGTLHVRLLVDNCAVEIFVDDGAATFTALVYPEEEVQLFRGQGDGREIRLVYQPLAPLWPAPAETPGDEARSAP